MSDPLRTEPIHEHQRPSVDGDAQRDAKIESLLLSGLDHYFASDYAQAIDVWTRALFLDRQHARARAYIERARSALAEQQRESDELLHNGVAAFERGEIAAARQLLNAAVQRGGAHEVALAFLTRIDRINAAAPSSEPGPSTTRLAFRPLTAATHKRHSRWGLLILIAVLAAAGVAVASWDQVSVMVPFLSSVSGGDLSPVRPIPDPLIVPTSSETALDRARTLFESGRLYDALRAIDLVRPTDPLRGDADKLKATIQYQLLAHQTSPGGTELAKQGPRPNPANPLTP